MVWFGRFDEDDVKNEENLKNEDNFKNKDNLKIKTTSKNDEGWWIEFQNNVSHPWYLKKLQIAPQYCQLELFRVGSARFISVQ